MFNRRLTTALVLLNVALFVFVFFVILTSEPIDKSASETTSLLIEETESITEHTEEPMPELIEEPAEEPMPELIEEPAEEPMPEPIEEPVEESVAEPIIESTEEPKPEPIAYPTKDATPDPTIVLPRNDYSAINKELFCLTSDGKVYPNYEVEPSYDLLNYFVIQNMDAPQLFDTLRQPFVNGIASWTAMQFDASRYGTDALIYALDSSVDDNCGRVRISNHPENLEAISNIFNQIRESKDFHNASVAMYDYLYKYTSKNPYSPNERWIIACN